MRAIFLGLVIVLAGLQAAPAQDLSALARLDAENSYIAGTGPVAVELAISQPVPWRVRVLADPPRVVLDVREVDWTGLDGMEREAGALLDLRAGVFRPGWSRLVMELTGPMLVAQSEMQTGEAGAVIRLRLDPADPAAFAAAAAVAEPADWALPKGADLPSPVKLGQGPVVVVLDPGHGGIDPGAERDGYTEANLMLNFARELKEALLRDGRFAVVMTREEDVFVPLEGRLTITREAGASVFISLHADALAEGDAQGATVYTLAEEASDEASKALAERHDRDDLLAGLDLSAQDDLVVTVLMDMARTETAPRTDRLATELVDAIQAEGLKMHRRPRQEAGFSVLKSPEVPSVLVELGFLSSARDLKRLQDPEWRAKMVVALVAGLAAWTEKDAAIRALRQE